MKKSKKIKSKIIRTLRFLFLIFCGIIIGIQVYLMNANNLVGNQLPMPFGYGAAAVLSGSMEPEFSQGDLIIVKEMETYNQDEIVVFQKEDTLVVHRIIQIDDETITTKGDANSSADEPIRLSDIKGKVILVIPFAGNIVTWLRTPVGISCTLLAAIALMEIPRRIEKKKDDEERQRILDEIERLKQEK